MARAVFGYCDNDNRLRQHAVRFMRASMEAAGAKDIWDSESTAHLGGTCRMGNGPETSVVDPNGRSWDIATMWACDGSLMPTAGGVNPSLTIQAMAPRIADRIKAMAARGELGRRPGAPRFVPAP